jgi:hypothetical protein
MLAGERITVSSARHSTIEHTARVPDDSVQTVVDELARLPVDVFVDVLHRVFDAREGDLKLRDLDGRYVLAVTTTCRPEGGAPEAGQVAVEFVARPITRDQVRP